MPSILAVEKHNLVALEPQQTTIRASSVVIHLIDKLIHSLLVQVPVNPASIAQDVVIHGNLLLIRKCTKLSPTK